MNICKYITAFALLLTLSQCTDLEEEPVGLLAPEAVFNTPQDVETVLISGYGILSSEAAYGRKYTIGLVLRSDMAQLIGSSAARRVEFDDFAISSTNGLVESFWPQFYRVISVANAALQGVDRIDATPEQADQLRAEARFLRAFSYYHLVRGFGDLPYIDRFVTDPESVASVELTPAQQIYEGVIADLEFAKEHLPNAWDQAGRSRATNVAAAAYLASVHLTRGNYELARAEAEAIIAQKGDYGVDLAPTYADLFDATVQDNLTEPIFYIDYKSGVIRFDSDQENVDFIYTHMQPTDVGGGFGNVFTNNAVVASFDPNDARTDVNVADTLYVQGATADVRPVPGVSYDTTLVRTGSGQTTAPVIVKYWLRNGASNDQGWDSDMNMHLMRYAEVLLIAAEANVELGNLAAAAAQINELRERTGLGDLATAGVAVGDQAAMRAAVREERRVELAFEFKRWYDIKRWQIIDEAYGPGGTEPKTPVPGPESYLFPRPQRDVDINPNLGN